MKKLIPLMIALSLTLGAVTAFSHSHSNPQSTKATKGKKRGTKKS